MTTCVDKARRLAASSDIGPIILRSCRSDSLRRRRYLQAAAVYKSFICRFLHSEFGRIFLFVKFEVRNCPAPKTQIFLCKFVKMDPKLAAAMEKYPSLRLAVETGIEVSHLATIFFSPP